MVISFELLQLLHEYMYKVQPPPTYVQRAIRARTLSRTNRGERPSPLRGPSAPPSLRHPRRGATQQQASVRCIDPSRRCMHSSFSMFVRRL